MHHEDGFLCGGQLVSHKRPPTGNVAPYRTETQWENTARPRQAGALLLMHRGVQKSGKGEMDILYSKLV